MTGSKRLTFLLRASSATVAAIGLLAHTIAVSELPSIRVRHGRPITPAAAWTYFGTSTISTSAWAQRPAEIKALARGLGAGRLTATEYADAVLNYVRQNIRVEFRFGLSKGALGVIADQSGTPFDQSHLMVELLREGGISASYNVGTATLNASQFGKWTGLITPTSADSLNKVTAFTVSARAACQLMADGGIPSNLGSSTGCGSVSGNLSTITFGHIWVSANGRLYDPAFKEHDLWRLDPGLISATCGAGLDCSTAATSALLTGATTGSNWLQSPNVAQLGNVMRTQAVAAENRARTLSQTNLTHLTLEQLIGGRKIAASQPGGTTLPFTVATQYVWTGNIPDQFRTRATVTLGALFNQSYFIDETAGRRTFLPQNLYTTAGTAFPNLSVAFNHPYPNSDLAGSATAGTYQDENVDSLAVPSGTATDGKTYFNTASLLLQTGFASPSTVAFMADQTKLDSGPILQCNQADPNKLVRIGADWASQYSQSLRLVEGVNDVHAENHHSIGLITEFPQFDASGVQLNTIVSANYVGALSVSSNTASTSAEKGAAGAAQVLFVSIEGSTIEQTLVSWSSGTASDLFRLKGQDGTRFFIAATPQQWNSVQGSLVGYSAQFKAYVGQFIADGYTVVIPREAKLNGTLYGLTVNDPRSGFIAWKPGLVRFAAIDHLLGKGAGSAENRDPVKPILESIKAPTAERVKQFTPSVDGATGKVNITFPADLTTGSGEFPYSLSLTRTYSSDSAGKSPCISYNRSMVTTSSSFVTPDQNDFLDQPGWRTSGDWDAQITNEADRALGSLSATDAAARVAGVLTLSHLARLTSQSIQSQMSLAIGGELLADQIEFNGVRIARDGSSLSFIRAADGSSYLPEPWRPENLIKSGPEPIKTGFLNSFIYNYQGIGFTLTDGDGSVTTFGQFGGYYPTFGDSNDGQSYTLIGTASYLNRFKSLTRTLPGSPRITFARLADLPPTPTMLASGNVEWRAGGQITQISNSLGRSIARFTSPTLPASMQAEVNANGMGNFVVTDDGRWVKYQQADVAPTAVGSCGQGQFFHYGPCTRVTSSLGSVTRQGLGRVDFTYLAQNPFTSASFGLRTIRTAANTSANPDIRINYNTFYRAEWMEDASLARTSSYPASIAGETTKFGTTVDPLGGVTRLVTNETGKPVQSTDPLGRTSAATYDNGGNVLTETRPEGDAVAYRYDLRGNRIEERRIAKPGATTVPDLVTQIAYLEAPTVLTCINKVTCNRPAYEITPSGARTNFTWNAATGLLESMVTGLTAAGICPLAGGICPTTTFTYSDFTGVDGVVFKLLTAKSERIDATQTVTTAYEYDPANKFVLKAAIVDPTGLNLRTCFRFDSAGNLISKTEPKAGLASCP